jgi:hypothetical protein
VTTPRERGEILLNELRGLGVTFALTDGRPTVRFSTECPSTPQLLQYIRENREAVVELLRAEQGLAPEPVVEPCNTVGLETAPEPEQPKVILVTGASSWSPSRGAVIRERLARIPTGVKVLITGDTEARSKRGLPVGVAAIARVALLGRDVDLVTADGLDAALERVGYVLVFHDALERSVGTAAVVAKARALRLPVEVVTGSVARENVEAAR